MPVSRGRKLKRPARAAHRSGRPGSSIQEAPDIPGRLMSLLATLDDPLDAELVLSDALGAAYELQKTDPGSEEAVELMASLLLETAESSQQSGALEMLAVLGTVGPDDVAATARTRVGQRVATEPALTFQPWITGLEPLRCTSALAMQDAFGDATEYLVAFTRGDHAHALLWLVDNNVIGGLARDVLVAADAEEIEHQLRALAAHEDQIPVTVTELDPAVLHGRLRSAMDLESTSVGPPEEESYARARMLAYGRLRTLPEALLEVDVVVVREEERDAIVADFVVSPERHRIPEDILDSDDIGHLARLIVDHAVDVIGGSPYRVTPSTAELFLMDWLPDHVAPDADEVELMPLVLAAWAAYALRIAPLGPPEFVIEAIAELAPDFDELMGFGD